MANTFAKQTFGQLKESLTSGDYTKNKKFKYCRNAVNLNRSNLISNLFTKENLKGVKVIDNSNMEKQLKNSCGCSPFYEQCTIDPCGQLFGNFNNCGENKYIEYAELSSQKIATNTEYRYNLGPWTHFSGQNNNSNRLSNYTGSQTGNSSWNYITTPINNDTSNNITTTPSIDSYGNIYFSYYNVVTNNSTFISLDSSGEIIWSIENITGLCVSSPMIDIIGNVYFCIADTANNNGSVYLYDSNGNEKWNFNITNGPIYSSPSLDSKGNIYFGTVDNINNNSSLYSITLQGIQTWKYDISGQIYSSPAIDYLNNIYFGSVNNNDSGSLYSINIEGKGLWNYKIPGKQIYSSPVLDSSINIYIGTVNNNIANNNELHSIDILNQLQNWVYDISGQIYSSPAIDSENNIYFGTADTINNIGYMYSITQQGLLKWRYTDLSGQIYSSPAIDSENNIYFSDFFDGSSSSLPSQSSLYAVNDNSGNLLWKKSIGTRITSTNILNIFPLSSSPSIGYNTLYIGGIDGILYKFH